MQVEAQLKAYAQRVDDRLAGLLPGDSTRPKELAEAMRYACLAPGKRMRPALCLASCEAVGGHADLALNAACALELVHCFSLIHDDLPALDNDDLRRGRPTCHKAFGEAIAILAGDALFALAFEAVAAPKIGLVPSHVHRIDCLRILTRAVGMSGLVAGEAADIVAEGGPVDIELLQFIHTHKTGALISASCEIGAVIGAGSPAAVQQLAGFGRLVGLAFQIADDILNETSTAGQLGKSAGSDREHRKATYPSLVGIEESRKEALRLAEEAVTFLDGLPGSADFLRDVAWFAVERMR